MNGRFKKIRTWAVLALAVLLVVQVLAIAPPASAAETADCLTMSGVGSVPVTDVDIDQEFEIEYTLTPSGDYAVVEQREAVDIALVLDVSGSMLYGLDGKTNAKAPNRRVDALRTATNGLIAKFKETNLDNVGLIQFSTKASKVALQGADSRGLTKNYTDLQNKINALNPSGSTNIDDALRKAKDMLTGSTRKKYVILLTDGAANMYGTNGTSAPNSSLNPTSKARTEALARANELKTQNITAYTIGLMTPDAIANINNPDAANKGEMDVYLMDQIASRTGGAFYTASNSASLAEVFESIVNVITNTTLRNITLKQPLPAGFDLADSELTNPNVKKEDGYLILNFEDIPYPFTQSTYAKKVKLKATSAVDGETHPLSDATVSYVNACSNKESFSINLDSTIRILGVTAIDMYGNKYYGNYRGELTRKRADNSSLQWTYTDPANRRITAIDFVKPDGTPDNGADKNHARVKLTFESGEPAILDLAPAAPGIQMADINGNTLTEATWATDTIRLKVDAASVSGLSAVNGRIVYTDEGKADFETGFIKEYQYTLDDGKTWQSMPYSGGEYSVALSAEGVYTAKVRAVNETISLSSNLPIYSNEAIASAKMDNTKPTGEGTVTIVINDAGVQNDAKIVISGSDSLSKVTKIEVWLDDRSSVAKEVEADSLQFLLSSIDGYEEAGSRYGWHQIKVRVTNGAGLSETYDFGELIPDFKINPGPQVTIGLVDQKGETYTSTIKKEDGDIPNWADKPIKVTVSVDAPVKARYGNPAVTIAESEYAISLVNEDTYTWKKLNSGSFYVTPGGAEKGTFKVHFKFKDTDGVEVQPSSDEVNIDYNQNRY